MNDGSTRREFLRNVGLSAAMLPFLTNLNAFAQTTAARRKQRLVIIFTPNGVVPKTFWPDEVGSQFALKESLAPFEPYKQHLTVLRGVGNRVRGDGDGHMRGIGCLLTGTELYPGNVQGGSDTPAGWASGLSIDQEIKNYLQSTPASRTRFGSLEFGVMVPDHADTWTRMVYSGPNRPVTPIDDPYQMFQRLYGQQKDQEMLGSILDELKEDMASVRSKLGPADRKLLDEHTSLVREMEKEIQTTTRKKDVGHAVPNLPAGIRQENDAIPQISKLQIDLMVSAFLSDAARIGTLQYTNSVGQARFTWLGIHEGQHDLSHEPDSNTAAQEKLTKINKWYAEQIAYLCKRLKETKEPDGRGTLFDNTTIVWTNELGQGNSHTLENIPWVIIGGGNVGIKEGQAVRFNGVPHNRLLMSLAHGYGHRIKTFGNRDFCGDGPLSLS